MPIASWLAVGVTSPAAVTVHQRASLHVETPTPLAVAAPGARHREGGGEHEHEAASEEAERHSSGIARPGAVVDEARRSLADSPVCDVTSRACARTHFIAAEHCARIVKTVQAPWLTS